MGNVDGQKKTSHQIGTRTILRPTGTIASSPSDHRAEEFQFLPLWPPDLAAAAGGGEGHSLARTTWARKQAGWKTGSSAASAIRTGTQSN